MGFLYVIRTKNSNNSTNKNNNDNNVDNNNSRKGWHPKEAIQDYVNGRALKY